MLVEIVIITRDARPRSQRIHIIMMHTGDIEQLRPMTTNPGPRIILVGNGIHSQFPDKPFYFIRTSSCIDFPQSLRQDGRAAPTWHPEGLVRSVYGTDQQLRTLTILALAHAIQSIDGETGLGVIDQELGLGPAIGHMDLEVGQNVAVDLQGVNDLALMRGVIQPVARSRDESLQAELVGVEQETDEGFGIIRFIGDVGENENARTSMQGLDGRA